MAAWGGLQNIFENPMPGHHLCPWGQVQNLPPSASFEIFGELCHPSSSSSSSSSPLPRVNAMFPEQDDAADALEIFGELCYSEKAPSFSKILEMHAADGTASTAITAEERRMEYMRSKSAQERSVSEKLSKKEALYVRSFSDVRHKSAGGGRWAPSFPPPITTIGRGGKPRVYFKSFRKDGRFVLKEIRIPTQRLLHATRQDGRLTMRVLRPDDEQGMNNEEELKEEEDDS